MAESALPDGVPEQNIMEQSAIAPTIAHQFAMQQQSATPTSVTSPAALPSNVTKDVEMSDRTPDRVPERHDFNLTNFGQLIHLQSPAIAPGATNNATSPMPRTGTPSRPNGNDIASRSASQHPDPAPTIPKEAPIHGAPTRQYLNGKVTGVLLEGMKQLAKEQPNDPLRVLGEYLLQKSKELEGGT